MMMGGLGMGFGIFGLLLMILFWVGLVAVAVWLIRELFPHTNRLAASPDTRPTSAREILDLRFARGEISREEYDLMRETISDGIE